MSEDKNKTMKMAYIPGWEKELLLTAVQDEISAAHSSLPSHRCRSLSPSVLPRQKHEARITAGVADSRGIARAHRGHRYELGSPSDGARAAEVNKRGAPSC